jgi:hypothetical protein
MSVQSAPRAAVETSSTALYCYGVTGAGTAEPLAGAGLGGKAVEPVPCGEIAALASAVPAGTVRARRRDLLAHFDVLGASFERGTVLPLRFGTVFDDEDALVEEFLRPRHDELAAMLREFDGRVELRVTAHYREDAILAEIAWRSCARRRVAAWPQATLRSSSSGSSSRRRSRPEPRAMRGLS